MQQQEEGGAGHLANTHLPMNIDSCEFLTTRIARLRLKKCRYVPTLTVLSRMRQHPTTMVRRSKPSMWSWRSSIRKTTPTRCSSEDYPETNVFGNSRADTTTQSRTRVTQIWNDRTSSGRAMESVIHNFHSDLFDNGVHVSPCSLPQEGCVVPSTLLLKNLLPVVINTLAGLFPCHISESHLSGRPA